jgi:hypothetical protein
MKPIIKGPRCFWFALHLPFQPLVDVALAAFVLLLPICGGAVLAFILLLVLPTVIFGIEPGSLSPLAFACMGLISILAGAALYFWRPWAPFVPFLYEWGCPKCGALVGFKAAECPECKAGFERLKVCNGGTRTRSRIPR